MSAGEDLAVGTPVSCVSKFAIVNVKLPLPTLRPVFDVDQFAVLSVAREPTACSCTPSRSFAPPRGCGCVVQQENAIRAVIQKELPAVHDRRDIDPSVNGLVSPAHGAELITSILRSTILSILFKRLADKSLGHREIR
jgi:hypothetical protein